MDNSPPIIDDSDKFKLLPVSKPDQQRHVSPKKTMLAQQIMTAAGIKFSVHNGGSHIVARLPWGKIHYWPSRQKWMADGGWKSERGIDGFLTACGVPQRVRAELLVGVQVNVPASVPVAPVAPAKVNVGRGIRTHTTLKICPAPCGIPPWKVCLDCSNGGA